MSENINLVNHWFDDFKSGKIETLEILKCMSCGKEQEINLTSIEKPVCSNCNKSTFFEGNFEIIDSKFYCPDCKVVYEIEEVNDGASSYSHEYSCSKCGKKFSIIGFF